MAGKLPLNDGLAGSRIPDVDCGDYIIVGAVVVHLHEEGDLVCTGRNVGIIRAIQHKAAFVLCRVRLPAAFDCASDGTADYGAFSFVFADVLRNRYLVDIHSGVVVIVGSELKLVTGGIIECQTEILVLAACLELAAIHIRCVSQPVVLSRNSRVRTLSLLPASESILIR